MIMVLRCLTDIKSAIKYLLDDTIKEMMEIEMDDHIGSSKNEHFDDRDNYWV